MNVFSLRTIIDDILLIVRNNNISESEDLSRDLIRAWVLAYKAALAKEKHDKDKNGSGDVEDSDDMSTTIGPMKLQNVYLPGECCSHTKRTESKLPALLGDSNDNITCVSDESGCAYLCMSLTRRHYHFFRRYTHHEPCFYFEDGYIYIDGIGDDEPLYIYVTGNFVEDGADDVNGTEDDVNIPGWMMPEIKKRIFNAELQFMLQRPSDDSNNSTLSSVKPNGPQDKEK